MAGGGRPRRGGLVVEPLQFHPAGLRFDPPRVRLRIFEWVEKSSIGSTWVRSRLEFVGRIFDFPIRAPGFDPATRTGPVSDVVSLSPSIRETRVRIRVRSNCHSEMARAIGIGTTETQRATPRNYADADGRDRRRREAAATALRMVSKMPRQTMTNT